MSENSILLDKICLSSYKFNSNQVFFFMFSFIERQIPQNLAVRKRLGVILLALMCAIWGTTFPILKTLTVSLGALDITLLRYGGAGVFLLFLVGGITRAEWRWGALLGLVLFAAFWLQTEGLAQTSSNRNAFITGLNVLAVPIFAIGLGQRPHLRLWAGCLLAAVGMWFLFYEEAPWNRGDSLTFIGMIFYAIYILLLEWSARANSAQPLRIVPLTALQGVMVGGCAALFLLLNGEWGAFVGRAAALNPAQWLSMAYLVLFASMLAPALQIWGQRYVSAVQSAIVYGLEPVFAAIAAYFIIQEGLSPAGLFGAALIVGALLLSQTPSKKSEQEPMPDGSL